MIYAAVAMRLPMRTTAVTHLQSFGCQRKPCTVLRCFALNAHITCKGSSSLQMSTVSKSSTGAGLLRSCSKRVTTEILHSRSPFPLTLLYLLACPSHPREHDLGFSVTPDCAQVAVQTAVELTNYICYGGAKEASARRVESRACEQTPEGRNSNFEIDLGDRR